MQGQRILIRDLLYQALREAVIDGELEPGERVTETMLAEQFGMSRTPLREAVARLEREHLMIRQLNGALTIAPLDMDQLAEIFDIQERIEGLIIASLARVRNTSLAQRLSRVLRSEAVTLEQTTFDPDIRSFDAEFHEVLWEYSRRNEAVEILEGFVGLFDRYYRLASYKNNLKERMKTVHNEHQLIQTSIAEGDPVWAEMSIKSHVRNCKKFLLDTYHEQGSQK